MYYHQSRLFCHTSLEEKNYCNLRLVFQKMESDDGDSDYDEPVQILYDIVPYREWEQEPEVKHA